MEATTSAMRRASHAIAKELIKRVEQREALALKMGEPHRKDADFEIQSQWIFAAVLREVAEAFEATPAPRLCRICGCTDGDCRQCIEKTGQPCHWVEWDLCSACAFPKLLTPYEVDDLLRYPSNRSTRLARKGLIPHLVLPDGSIRFDEAVIAGILRSGGKLQEAAKC